MQWEFEILSPVTPVIIYPQINFIGGLDPFAITGLLVDFDISVGYQTSDSVPADLHVVRRELLQLIASLTRHRDSGHGSVTNAYIKYAPVASIQDRVCVIITYDGGYI